MIINRDLFGEQYIYEPVLVVPGSSRQPILAASIIDEFMCRALSDTAPDSNQAT